MKRYKSKFNESVTEESIFINREELFRITDPTQTFDHQDFIVKSDLNIIPKNSKWRVRDIVDDEVVLVYEKDFPNGQGLMLDDFRYLFKQIK